MHVCSHFKMCVILLRRSVNVLIWGSPCHAHHSIRCTLCSSVHGRIYISLWPLARPYEADSMPQQRQGNTTRLRRRVGTPAERFAVQAMLLSSGLSKSAMRLWRESPSHSGISFHGGGGNRWVTEGTPFSQPMARHFVRNASILCLVASGSCHFQRAARSNTLRHSPNCNV